MRRFLSKTQHICIRSNFDGTIISITIEWFQSVLNHNQLNNIKLQFNETRTFNEMNQEAEKFGRGLMESGLKTKENIALF